MSGKETKKEEKKEAKSENLVDQKVVELEKSNQELVSHLQRLQAEFQNYQKRVEKEQTEFAKFASANLISKLLPVLDNIQLAEKNKDNKDEFVKGTEMIFNQLLDVLKQEGLEKVHTVGQKFDPFFHEALLQEESDKDNVILEEFQPGYKLHGKLLRHAKVKIGKKVK